MLIRNLISVQDEECRYNFQWLNGRQTSCMWSDCLIYVSCELELSLHGDMVSTHYKFCVNHKSALSPGGGDLKLEADSLFNSIKGPLVNLRASRRSQKRWWSQTRIIKKSYVHMNWWVGIHKFDAGTINVSRESRSARRIIKHVKVASEINSTQLTLN